MIVLFRLDHDLRLRPEVQCGRHRNNDPDANSDSMELMKKHKNILHLSEFPQKELERFEAKSGLLYQVLRDVFANWPRFNLNALTTSDNSLWYYPHGHSFDCGIAQPRPQLGLSDFKLPRHLVIEATPETAAAFPLTALLKGDEFPEAAQLPVGPADARL